MDSRTKRSVDYDDLMQLFVTKGLAKNTDAEVLKELLNEIQPMIDGMDFESYTGEADIYPHLCKVFNAIIGFVRNREPQGTVHDLRALITAQHGQGASIHDSKVDISFYDMSRTPHEALNKTTQAKESKKKASETAPAPPSEPLSSASESLDSGKASTDPPSRSTTPTRSDLLAQPYSSEAFSNLLAPHPAPISTPTTQRDLSEHADPSNTASKDSSQANVPAPLTDPLPQSPSALTLNNGTAESPNSTLSNQATIPYSNSSSHPSSHPSPQPERPLDDAGTSANQDDPESVNQAGPESNNSRSEDGNLIARCLYEFVRMFVEVKFNVDPYKFPRGNPDRFSPAEDEVYGRGQIAEYAGECMERQHRLFFFSLYILKDQFSIQIWDRDGMIMSKYKDYKKDPMALVRFLYYFVKMSDDQVGYDPTVSAVAANSEDVIRMKAKIEGNTFADYPNHVQKYVKEAMKAVLRPNDLSKGEAQTPIYKVGVPENHVEPCPGRTSAGFQNPSLRHFLIGRRFSSSGAEPFGRGTKGYVAYDLQEDEFVFLKDAWRDSSSNPEASTYRLLEKKEVQNIATLCCGGDMPGQSTITHPFLDNFKQPMYHHRLVLKEIGMPLKEYQTSQQLCSFVYSALLAHQYAYEDAQILHRDISENNIVILAERDAEGDEVTTGVLIDWDLSKSLEQLKSNKFSDGNRSGTWYYLSAPRLAFPGKPWELPDDLESFVHLINHFALRFHLHDLKYSTLPAFLHDRYETCYYNPDIRAFWGCVQKIRDVQNGTPGFNLLPNPETGLPTNLSRLISTLMKMCQQHWLSLDQKALSQYAVPEDAKHKPTTEEQSTGASSNKLFKIKQVQPKRIAGSQNVQGLIPVETTKRPQSPFENHTVIVTTLKKACEMEGWPTKRDRTTVDQLADLDGRIVKVIRSTRALRLTSVRNSVASSTNPSGRLANVGGKSGSNKRSSKSGNRDRGSTSRAQTESRGGSHKRNASTRAGSKRKATCEPLLEDTAEPELAEGTSTDVAGDSEVSARSRNSKRSRLQ